MCNLNNLPEILEQLSGSISIENRKHYWMIRTDNGLNYQDFSENNYIALNLRDYPIAFLREFANHSESTKEVLSRIKQHLKYLHRNHQISIGNYSDERQYNATIGRLAGQIYTIAYDLHYGDIVIIPDQGARRLKIGRIVDHNLIAEEAQANHFSFARKVEWIKEISKIHLDPCLNLALGAHQAICDISKYAEFIERNYNSCYAYNGKYNYVLTVNSEEISAFKLTALIQEVLIQVKHISDVFDLGIDINSINISINVNSPGKFGFSTTVRNAVLIIAMFNILSGGSTHFGNISIETDGLLSSLTDCIIRLQNNQEELREKRAAFDSYMQSLDVKSVEEWNAEIGEYENEEIATEATQNQE